MKTFIVFGTRPEAIKMCPLVIELLKDPFFDVRVVTTGQHLDMLGPVLSAFSVVPDFSLSTMEANQSLCSLTNKALSLMDELLGKEEPDLVLVHGDTTSAFSAGLASFYRHIPLAHVEAGLRTYNSLSPFPEEFNRVAISAICDYHFAPTALARDNLLREGKNPNMIWITGNTVIDALATTVRPDYSNPDLDWASGSRLLLVTAHRRENIGTPMESMFRGIRAIADSYPDVKVIYPVHKNPNVRKIANELLSGHDRIRLVEPLDPISFHNYMARCFMVLTDSGGIQEEAPSFGKPVLVMRNTTERPEGVDAGVNILVGTDGSTIFQTAAMLLNEKKEYEKISRIVNPYGDGHAAERIAQVLKGEFSHRN